MLSLGLCLLFFEMNPAFHSPNLLTLWSDFPNCVPSTPGEKSEKFHMTQVSYLAVARNEGLARHSWTLLVQAKDYRREVVIILIWGRWMSLGEKGN